MKIIDFKKKNQRLLSIKKRQSFRINKKAEYLLQNKIIKIDDYKKAKTVATFISIKTEIPMNELNKYLEQSKKIICLPVIIEDLDYLIFRKFDANTNLIKGKFGVWQPDKNNIELLPDLILTPCLAFDQFGYRLGYGGGYYDQTFMQFKKQNHKFVSVAVAYDDQKVIKVMHDDYDQKIDYTLTEKEIYRNT